jgi:ATP-dependent Clp protease, protease subunit
MYTPSIIEKENGVERSYDVLSYMLKHRNIYLIGEVNEASANSVILQMQFLAAEDSNKDINFYINSPGGHVDQGLAILDTMETIKCDVNTIGYGICASMGAFLLTMGTSGKRYAMPNLNLMYHQPSGGSQGQMTDMVIVAEHITKTRHLLEKYLSERTGINQLEMNKMCERDNYLTAKEALELKFIDKIVTKE